VAVRLDGPPLPRLDRGELPSEPLVPGAVQVPPDGLPVVFGADHPVTGGYPVPAVVEAASVDAAAQLRPGDAVRFAPAG
jgi:allophanate hydrolase subunit 2